MNPIILLQKMKNWIRSNPQELLKTPIYTIHSHEAKSQDSDKAGKFFTLNAPDWINVIAITEENEVIVISQYRHGTDEITLEIPGGASDPGEDPIESAKRELLEETGFISEEWESLGKTAVNPAIMTNYTHMFIAKNCKKVAEQQLDGLEEIDIEFISIQEFLQKIVKMEIDHSLILSAVAKWLIKEANLSRIM